MLAKWLWFVQIFFVVSYAEDKGLVSVKSAKCFVNKQFVFPNVSCFAKSYSRNISTANVNTVFKLPLERIFVSLLSKIVSVVANYFRLQVSLQLQFKYGVIYRDAIKKKSLDFCEQLANIPKANLLVKEVLAVLKAHDPKTVHSCPFSVKTLLLQIVFTGYLIFQELVIKNFTLNTKYMKSVFPTGDYKYNIFVKNGFQVPLFNLSTVVSFKKPNRDTFG